MEKILKHIILAHKLIPPRSHGLVAFSGGPDSLCLLHVLHCLTTELGFTLIACHVDHRLRPTSQDDARHAQALAEQFKIPIHIETATIVRTPGENLHDLARRERKDLLLKVAQDHRCDWIGLGHNANDQAETVLMRMVRGTGVRGLSGMRWNASPWIRPLLGTDRREIEAYLERCQLQPVRDPTNESDRFFRNRVRRQLLPLLETENPSIVATLCRLAENCDEENDALERYAQEELGKAILERNATFVRLDAKRLSTLSPTIQFRIVHRVFCELTEFRKTLTRRHVTAIATAIQEPSGRRKLHLPGILVFCSRDVLELHRCASRDEKRAWRNSESD